MGIIVEPTAYITWIPKGDIHLKPTDAYITWLPLGAIYVKPQIATAWVPMGTIHLKPQIIASFVTPWQWQTSVKADAARKVVQANDARADTSLKTTRSNTALADTKRSLYSPFIAIATADLLRQVIMPNSTTADTQRMVGGEWVVIEADTRRLLGADYCVMRGDTWRSVSNVARTTADTLRIRGIGNMVSADTLIVVGWGKPSSADLLRRVVKQERTPADTSIRVPWVLEYVNRNQPVRAKAKRSKSVAATPITQNFRDHGIRSFSMTLGELTLSDTFQLETVQPMNIDDEVQGQIFDYRFHFLVEETSQRDLIQTVKGMYSKDALLYTAINATVSELNVSYYARQIATALGLEVNMVCDDFIPSQNFENAGMTYQDMISALFGWNRSSKRPVGMGEQHLLLFTRQGEISRRHPRREIVAMFQW